MSAKNADPLSPERFWRNTKHLKSARKKALRVAETLWEQRQRAAEKAKANGNNTAEKARAFALHHSGQAHTAFFHNQLKPLISKLPKRFQAIEVGAGMGLLAALLAAYGNQQGKTGSVLATEMYWLQDSPTAFQHAGTYAHLLTQEPALRRVLKVHSNSQGLPLHTTYHQKRLKLCIASAHELPTPANRFHLVYSLNCLEHIPNLSAYTQEAHRVLKPGGLFFNSTMPLYASCFGHHCQDFYPLPWGHLLWEPQEFARLILKGSRGHVEWTPGTPLTEQHIIKEILPTLNAYTPKDFRKSLRSRPWKVEGLVEHIHPNDAILAKELGLPAALKTLGPEDFTIHGLTLLLRKTKGPSWSPALNLSHGMRKTIRLVTRVIE
ncbi:MAG: class I SAM-dependent methyltransferase [Sumerlaeia bacterium]